MPHEPTDVASRLLPPTAVRLRTQSPTPRPESRPHRQPITCGVPWPKGALKRARDLVLLDSSGKGRALQARRLDSWSDGTVRWALLDWLSASLVPETLWVGVPRDAPSEAPSSKLAARRSTDGGIEVETGRASFRLGQEAFPFGSVECRRRSVIDPAATRLVVRDRSGADYAVAPCEATIEESGTVRATVALTSRLVRPERDALVDLEARLHFFADSATVRFELTLRNPRAAEHPGGIWCLGDRGSVLIREASLVLALAPGEGPVEVFCSPEPDRAVRRYPRGVELYQDSSGGDNWKGPNHVNRSGEVPVRFRGYRCRAAGEESFGRRATPIGYLEGPDRWLGVAVPRFWEKFPKSLRLTPEGIEIGLLPREFADEHELQGGEQTTHTFFLAFDRDGSAESALEWCRDPASARAEPAWYAAAQAVPYLVPQSEDPNRGYLDLVAAGLEGDHSFFAKREIIDEYGWRNFGDLYADHEAVRAPEGTPLVSHYNNQYDAIAGLAIQFMRSGDPRWYRLMDDLAHHVIDIDLYHTDRDRSAFNRGMFWHTFHYVDAGTSSHRAYPATPEVEGGGPAAEHLYSAGLMLHYFFTGNRASREAAVRLGQWVIDLDDGSLNVMRLIDRGHTGWASASGSRTYHGPGRASANSINALMVACRLTGERRYLDKAQQLMRRCIHPHDDIEALDLLDTERRWFYTVFLQALGNYLEHKAERDELDQHYAYARASLLHYARWMEAHERPFLDHPEQLEYPTETWAAQDMRKCEILEIASRHTDGPERQRFLERAAFFFDYSTRTLGAMPTKTLCRPVVLMLSYGYRHSYFQTRPVQPAPEPRRPIADFGPKKRFLGQRDRVLRRLLAAAGILAVVAVVLILVLY